MKHKYNLLILLAFLLITANLTHAQQLKIYSIDVNQGSSTLIVSPTNKSILIDAGEVIGNYGDSVYRFIKNLGFTHLDYTLATHYHSDHIGGFPVVICSLSKRAGNDSILNYCYDRGDVDTFASVPFRNYRNLVNSKRRTIVLGETINLGGGAMLVCVVKNGKVLNGDSVISLPAGSDNENYRSIGCVLKYGFFQLWIGGDLTGIGGERDVESKVAPIVKNIDVYIANHHGSSTSSTQTFLDSIHPRTAIFSMGPDNSYGHPHQPTINRMIAETCYMYQLNENATGGTFTVPDSGKILNRTAQITVNDWQYVINGDTYLIKGVRRDGTVLEIISPQDTIAEGSLVTPKALIKNLGNITESFPIRMKIGSTYNNLKIVSNLQANTADTVTFDTIRFSTRGNYTVICSTEVPRDSNRFNDKKTLDFTVAFFDAEIAGILKPKLNDTLSINDSIAPKIIVKDNSVYSNPSLVKIYFRVQSTTTIYLDSVSKTLNPGQTDTISFTKKSLTDISEGTYRCSTWITRNNDLVLNNNFKSNQFYIKNISGPWLKLKSISGIKPVKAGGALVTGHQDRVYAFKGNNTREFYVYYINNDSWENLETIPDYLIYRKRVGKGASLTYNKFSNPHRIYAIKGNNTLELWEYNVETNSWSYKSNAPLGPTNKKLKGGAGIVFNKQGNQTYLYLLKGNNTNEFYCYHFQSDAWITNLEQAPLGINAKKFKDGSSITITPNNKIYALKGGAKYNEFYCYDIAQDTWVELESVPRYNPLTRKKTKVKDGAAICYNEDDNSIYAIKGGNSQDFWKYNIEQNIWSLLDTVPLWQYRKKIGSGGALVFANNKIYALKGNKTNEFWSYDPSFAPSFIINNDPQNLSICNLKNKISLQDNPTPVFIQIYNTSGQLIKTVNGYYNKKDLQTNLQPGIYFIRIYNQRHTFTEKSIIIK